MTLLDAYAVIAFLRGEPAADEVHRLASSHLSPAITAANAAEVIDHLVRVGGVGPDDAVLDLAQLDVAILPVDDRTAVHAGLLRARHYSARTRAVSLADCIAAAAVLNDARLGPLATADPHLLDLVHAEGGRVHPLPSSDGSRWSA